MEFIQPIRKYRKRSPLPSEADPQIPAPPLKSRKIKKLRKTPTKSVNVTPKVSKEPTRKCHQTGCNLAYSLLCETQSCPRHCDSLTCPKHTTLSQKCISCDSPSTPNCDLDSCPKHCNIPDCAVHANVCGQWNCGKPMDEKCSNGCCRYHCSDACDFHTTCKKHGCGSTFSHKCPKSFCSKHCTGCEVHLKCSCGAAVHSRSCNFCTKCCPGHQRLEILSRPTETISTLDEPTRALNFEGQHHTEENITRKQKAKSNNDVQVIDNEVDQKQRRTKNPPSESKDAPAFYIHFYNEDTDWDKFFKIQENYWGIKAINTKRYLHPDHAKEACTRLFAEQYMHKHMLEMYPFGSALKIGNPNRDHLPNRMPGHTVIQSVLDPQRTAENLFKSFYAHKRELDHCMHQPWLCDCGQHDVVIASDAMYHLTPYEWYATLLNTQQHYGVSSFNVGDQPNCEQIFYDNKVTIKIPGNDFVVEHWNLSWWETTNCCTIDNDVMIWKLLKHTGSLKVYAFMIVAADLFPGLLPLPIVEQYPGLPFEDPSDEVSNMIAKKTTWKTMSGQNSMSAVTDTAQRLEEKLGVVKDPEESALAVTDALLRAKKIERAQCDRIIEKGIEPPMLSYKLKKTLNRVLVTPLQFDVDSIKVDYNLNETTRRMNKHLNLVTPAQPGASPNYNVLSTSDLLKLLYPLGVLFPILAYMGIRRFQRKNLI